MVKRNKPGAYSKGVRLILAGVIVAPVLSACGFFGFGSDSKVKFSEAAYGVSASPRVTRGGDVPKGGGHYMVGKPYKVAGRWYRPQYDPHYDKVGTASWYGPNFHGRLTANGEVFDQYALSAASPTLPLPSYVRVTNLENHRSVIVRVNDRGPYAHGRLIDLSGRAASMLGFVEEGTAKVRVQYVGKAPLEGDDTRILLASYNAPSPLEQGQNRTLMAFANTPKPVDVAPQPAPVPAAAALRTMATGGSEPISLLSYANAPKPAKVANGGALIDSAFAAVTAVAEQSKSLEPWRQSMDATARKVDLRLGVFARKDKADDIATRFAMLGAVEEEGLTWDGKTATLLRLTYLKAGVTRGDVLALARQSGLEDVAF